MRLCVQYWPGRVRAAVPAPALAAVPPSAPPSPCCRGSGARSAARNAAPQRCSLADQGRGATGSAAPPDPHPVPQPVPLEKAESSERACPAPIACPAGRADSAIRLFVGRGDRAGSEPVQRRLNWHRQSGNTPAQVSPRPVDLLETACAPCLPPLPCVQRAPAGASLRGSHAPVHTPVPALPALASEGLAGVGCAGGPRCAGLPRSCFLAVPARQGWPVQ